MRMKTTLQASNKLEGSRGNDLRTTQGLPVLELRKKVRDPSELEAITRVKGSTYVVPPGQVDRPKARVK